MRTFLCVLLIVTLVYAEPPSRRFKPREHVESEGQEQETPYPPSGFTPAKEFKLPAFRMNRGSNEQREKIRMPFRQQLPEPNSLYDSSKEFTSSKYSPQKQYGVPEPAKDVRESGEEGNKEGRTNLKLTLSEAPTNRYFPPVYGPPKDSDDHEVASLKSSRENAEGSEHGQDEKRENREEKKEQKERKQEAGEQVKEEKRKEERAEKREAQEKVSEEKKERTEDRKEQRDAEKVETRQSNKEEFTESSNKESNNNRPYIVFLPTPNFGPVPYQNKVDFSNVGYSTFFQQRSLEPSPFPFYYQPKMQPANYYLPSLPFNNGNLW